MSPLAIHFKYATLIIACLSLLVFASADPLVRLSLTMISHTLSPDAVIEIRRVFQAVDFTHSGVILARDLSSATIACQAVASGSIQIDSLLINLRLKAFCESTSPVDSHQARRNASISSMTGSLLGSENLPSLAYHDFLAAMIFSRFNISALFKLRRFTDSPFLDWRSQTKE